MEPAFPINKIYIAGSFSTPEERTELEAMIQKVREMYPRAELFIPMEHFVPGGNDKDEVGNYIMPNAVWGAKVFEMDLMGLTECDAVANLYRGHKSGTGTAWELGYAYATGMYIIQFISETAKTVSVMCYNCADEHIGNTNVEQK